MRITISIQTIRIVGLCILAFVTMTSYSLSRHPVDSLFLQHHSAANLPIAWLLTAIFAAVVMIIYNHFNTKHSLLKLFSASAAIAAFLLFMGILAYRAKLPGAVYFLYLWKEIYIVLLVEIFWSFSDIVFTLKSARWLYGLLLAMGSTGASLGNLLTGTLATSIGTASALWWVLPVLLFAALLSRLIASVAGDAAPPASTIKSHWGNSFRVVAKSQYLVPLLLLVAIIQICISLIDYQFNAALELHYPHTDERTNIMGNVYAAIDFIALFLQLSSGYILRLVGVSGVLLSIPLILGFTTLTFLILPRFLMMVTVKVASKCFDYSLMRSCKEMLYIPLNRDEKTQGKALIDILVYRIAKGFSSVLVLGMIYFDVIYFSTYFTSALLLIWILISYIIVNRYKKVYTLNNE